jgi:hypothetical protein
VAAQEQQHERVVPVRWPVAGLGRVRGGLAGGRLPSGDGVLAAAAGVVAVPLVDQCPAGDGQQPGPRPVGYPVAGPLLRGGQQRLLDGVLAGVEVPVPAQQGGEDLRREFAQQVLHPAVGAHPGRRGVRLCGPVTVALARP